MATLFSLIEVIHLKKLYYCIQDSLYYHISIIHYNFFLLFLYLFCLSLFISVFFMLLLCFIISALFIYISFRFQNIFHIFPNMYFPISTNIYFPISLKTNPLSSLMYPLFCFSLLFLRSKRQPPKYKELLMKIKSLR